MLHIADLNSIFYVKLAYIYERKGVKLPKRADFFVPESII